jgi:hypothetical protein
VHKTTRVLHVPAQMSVPIAQFGERCLLARPVQSNAAGRIA